MLNEEIPPFVAVATGIQSHVMKIESTSLVPLTVIGSAHQGKVVAFTKKPSEVRLSRAHSE